MSCLSDVLHGMQPQDWFMSVDLHDAYFHVTITTEHTCCLRFVLHSMKLYLLRMSSVLSSDRKTSFPSQSNIPAPAEDARTRLQQRLYCNWRTSWVGVGGWGEFNICSELVSLWTRTDTCPDFLLESPSPRSVHYHSFLCSDSPGLSLLALWRACSWLSAAALFIFCLFWHNQEQTFTWLWSWFVSTEMSLVNKSLHFSSLGKWL